MSDDSEESAPGKRVNNAAVFIERLTVRNFRGISQCELVLQPDLTLLVGRNNAGKSRILRALAIALSAMAAERDDLTVSDPTACEIDVVLAPSSASGQDETFDIRIARRLRGNVQLTSESPLKERVAWRTVIKPSREGFGVRSESTFLTFDLNSATWVAPANPLVFSASVQRAIIVGDLVETRRDLVTELTARGSPIRRILDDLEIDPTQRQLLESGLAELGVEIIGASSSLAALSESLDALSANVTSLGKPHLSALPPKLEELSRAVSIDFDTGRGRFPIRLQGAGSRSLASLQVQSVLYDRRVGRDGPELRPQAVSLIEEPEAHLHPQAQFELAEVLTAVSGQTIVSTHSSHLAATVPFESIRMLQADGAAIRFADFRPSLDAAADRARKPAFHLDEMEKLRRTIERPFGELLFASAVVIGDGATERALIPPLLRHAAPDLAHGVCVVDPGSMHNAEPVVKFAELVGIPWLLFSDSDPEGAAAARDLDKRRGTGDESHIVWLGSPGADGCATEVVMIDFDEQLCRAACASVGLPAGEDVLRSMTKRKGSIGRSLAMELIHRYPDRVRARSEPSYWPTPVFEIIQKLTVLIGRQ